MKNILPSLLLTGLIAAISSVAPAQTSMVPNAMNYQGLLTDDSGIPVAATTPENRNVEFRIYSQAAGGTALWGEAQTVTVFKGNFSVILGNGTSIGVPSGPAAFAAVFTNATTADLFFGITPQGGAEFAPRQKLLSSAFALRAKTAETVNASAQPAGQPSQFNWLSSNNTTLNGHTKVNGGNVVEFGFGLAKGGSNGMIGYQAFSNGLDIVGAGTASDFTDRRITMHAQGGTDFLGPISFGTRLGQHINLWGNQHGLGIENNTMYFRTGANQVFRWYDGGSSAGGGRSLAYLNPTGLTLEVGKFTGDGSGLTNVPIPSTVNNLTLNGTIEKNGHGPFVRSFGDGHVFGSQDFTTYSRSARNFAWYTGGSHNGGEFNPGGGTTVMSLNNNGLTMNTGGITIQNSGLNMGARTGQHLNLYNSEYGIGVQANTLYSRTGRAFSWYAGGTHGDNENDAGGGTQIAKWSNGLCDFYRRVFIGASPTDGFAPLWVNGSSNQYFGNISEFWFPNNGGAGYNGRSNYATNVSIRASNAVAAAHFVATSDERLKVPVGRSSTAKDLATLSALEVTNYTMKDKTLDGGKPHKKLIAQQLEKVYPQAVSTVKGVVPDIFRVAMAKNGVVTFKTDSGVSPKSGETIRLVQGKTDLTTTVTGTTENGFTVKETVADGEIFVYGREVEDLRVVDYEAVSMLNVSATQELFRLYEQQAEATKRLEAEKAELEQQMARMQAKADQQGKRLASIETVLSKLALPVGNPSAATPKVSN